MIATPSNQPIEWREYVVCDPAILCGKPTLKGTRLSVEFVLGLLAGDWHRDSIQTKYPNLTAERIRAVLAFAGDNFKDFQYAFSARIGSPPCAPGRQEHATT